MNEINAAQFSVIGGDPIRLMVECGGVYPLTGFYREFVATGSIPIELVARIPAATKLRVTLHVDGQYREFPAAFIQIDEVKARIVPTMEVDDFRALLESVGATMAGAEPKSESAPQRQHIDEPAAKAESDFYGLESDEPDHPEPVEPGTGPLVTDASARLREALKQRASLDRAAKRNFRRTPVERGDVLRELPVAGKMESSSPARGRTGSEAVVAVCQTDAEPDSNVPDTGPVRMSSLRSNDRGAANQRPKLRVRPAPSGLDQADEPQRSRRDMARGHLEPRNGEGIAQAEVKRRPRIKARPDPLSRDEENSLEPSPSGPETGPVRLLSESGEDLADAEPYRVAQLRTRIESLWDSIDRASHFEVLGIHWTAQKDEVATAVTGIRRVLASPDLQEADDELRQKAKKLMPQIERIKDILLDKTQRSKYRKKIVSPFEVQIAVDLIKDSIETACYQNDTRKLGDLFAQVLELSPQDAKRIRDELRGRTFKR